ncbi:kinase [Photobacterium sanctipauli]|uniref:Kinase n=2 Tax=Photobacterium sanctipauli TaxID=1342794 RepID=A0A2T3NYT2_9GAMM|nr:GTPase [Photobacterium sanctipauli]PSW21369.1 kinase [Photobacterium sanctipauli]
MSVQQFFKQVYQYITPSADDDFQPLAEQWKSQLPTLWLLGKTGAGKSSLIEAVTGDSSVDIGNGFQPCTQASMAYSFPISNPLIRFLDTRGLSEADYDASEDIALCQSQSNALIVVMKAEEPEQSDVVRALKQIRKDGQIKQLLVVHTGVLAITPVQRTQAIAHNQQQVEAVWGEECPHASVDFIDASFDANADADSFYGQQLLVQSLTDVMPMLYMLLDSQQHKTHEAENFAKLKSEVMWYASTASASDVLPAVGLVSVPAIQGKMLHSLGCHYGVEWNKQRFTEFASLLGGSFAVKYLTKLGVRQIAKFIPVYGQTIGSAVAAAISFGVTYAIGRAACMYLYHISKGEPVSPDEIKAVFEAALKQAKESREKHEANNE